MRDRRWEGKGCAWLPIGFLGVGENSTLGDTLLDLSQFPWCWEGQGSCHLPPRLMDLYKWMVIIADAIVRLPKTRTNRVEGQENTVGDWKV